MSQQIIKTVRAPASVLFKVWNLSRAKQGVFQERTGRGFRKMSNKIPSHFPKTQLPKPQTLQQSGKASMFFSHTPQTKILNLSTLTGETQAPTPGTQTQLPPNLAYDKGSTETASLVEPALIDKIFCNEVTADKGSQTHGKHSPSQPKQRRERCPAR